jgi:hypothetical protein
MVDGEPYFNFSLEDVGIDGDGRLIFATRRGSVPSDGATVSEHRKKPPPPTPLPNTNCFFCNAAGGCDPVNTVKGCGSIKP